LTLLAVLLPHALWKFIRQRRATRA
jgi:hypothetical protein